MATRHELESAQAQNMDSIRGMSYEAARDLGYTPTPDEAEAAIAGADRLAEAVKKSGETTLSATKPEIPQNIRDLIDQNRAERQRQLEQDPMERFLDLQRQRYFGPK